MPFSPADLFERLAHWPRPEKYWVAFSGGLDSSVLLHALASLRSALAVPVGAIHLNHGLQSPADAWARHCADFCGNLGVDYLQRELALLPPKGVSVEAFAREARYRELRDLVGEGEMLLTAHHRDDQAETLLLQLLRGGGLAGLAGMPMLAPFARGWLGRPLLGVDRRDLLHYGQSEGVAWVDDPTNFDTRYDRNFLRNQVIPILRQRWLGFGGTLSRTAALCAEAQELIDDQARRDLSALTRGTDSSRAPTHWERRMEERLSDADPKEHSAKPAVEGLAALSPPRARAALRLWIREAGAPMPEQTRLEELLREMVGAATDRNPVVEWSDFEARRFRGRIHLIKRFSSIPEGLALKWEGETLELPAGLGRLSVEATGADGGYGIDPKSWGSARRQVRFRVPGARCRSAGKDCHRSLKHLFQEWGVPPWWRERLPLLYLEGQLAAVADLGVCHPYASAGGLRIVWERR